MRRAGGAAVEFAITLPVLMVLLAGVIEWGCFLQRQVSVVQAARDGALAASLTPRSGDAAATAEERARSSLELAGVDGAADRLRRARDRRGALRPPPEAAAHAGREPGRERVPAGAAMSPRRGASALEMAFILPILLLVLAGIMDWSMMLFQQMSVVVAAGRGARIAAGVAEREGPTALARASAEAWLARFGLDPELAEVSASLGGSGDAATITVTVSVPYRPLVGLIPMPDRASAVVSGVYYGNLY